MEPFAVPFCFPRGLISLNTSVTYLIEPLPVSTDAQQHAVFRAESLHLSKGRCLHHHGNEEHEEGLDGFIRGMMSPRSRRVSSDRMNNVISIKSFAGFTQKQNNNVSSCSVLNFSIFHFKERRDLSQNMKYVELLLVADKAEVRRMLRMCACFITFNQNFLTY